MGKSKKFLLVFLCGIIASGTVMSTMFSAGALTDENQTINTDSFNDGGSYRII